MSEIMKSIGRLTEALNYLEEAASQQEQQKLILQQQDLFGGDNVVALDPAVIAKKLDVAIERVEQILQEG
ncbi:MAG: hypothetical protein QF692_05030 [Alphaproteobacteria bacterium]|nr:hypothetical protein [Alphaproteobacteria bacterium]MDP7222610.1 hypothetical protein [Alphaproteobacteria bacterium]